MKTSMMAAAFLLALPALATPAAAHDNQGFLYGRITAESGTVYEGLLRWGDEESFWDDHFNSSKEDLPWLDEAREQIEAQGRDRGNRREIKVFGYRIRVEGDDWGGSSRQFIARYGDIAAIEPVGSDGARITMKNGAEYEVEGYSNDVGGTVTVQDASVGTIDLKWRRIETIEFLPTPSSVKPEGTRLHGTVFSDEGEFTGHIQWDKQECLSTDILDGDGEDGDMQIAMGRLRSIERRGRNSSRVELDDGRRLRLRGSNDVDDDNRGIVIEDPRYGRVEVSWDDFDRIEFSEPRGSGRAYDEFPGEVPLLGSVGTVDGDELAGRIIYDLDEAAGWELLNGKRGDVEFSIPFHTIRRIEPMGHDACEIVLWNGETLELEDGQDVSENNDGVLVLQDGAHVYVPFDEVEWIEFRR